MDLATFEAALTELAGAEVAELGTAEVLVALEGALSRLEAVVVRSAAAFEAASGYLEDGARNAASWMAMRTRLPKSTCRRQLRLGRALRSLPECEAGFGAGEISSAHVGAIAGLGAARTEEVLARDEALLVAHARTLRFDEFVRALRYWDQLADPDGCEDAAMARRARRDVQLAQSFEGTFFGRITLDEIAGSIVAGELARLEHRLFDADRAAAGKANEGGEGGELCRSSAERRGDALVEMARRSAALVEDAPAPPVLLSVLVDYDTLHGRVCELADGTVVTPGSLLSYLDAALVERVVFTSPTRAEVSAKARLFSGATRRAIEVRDRRCQHPSCDVRAARCEVDHIVPVAQHGPTIQENGRLLCGWHNRLRLRRDGGLGPPPADP